MRNLIFFLFLIPFCNLAHEYKDSNIVIKHPVLKLISKDSNTAAGYLSIENNSSKEIVFKGIISDIAKTQEIHEVILKNNVYKMRPVQNGISIIPGNKLELKPKSYHLMFFDINKLQLSNEMIEAKLMFDNNIIINVKFKVEIGHVSHSH